jgi:hypothetical protein
MVTRLLILALLCAGRVMAQADYGFTLLASGVMATTYTDGTCADATACFYEVTAVLGGVESSASNTAVAIIPASGTHTVTLSWTVPASGPTPTGYNVYVRLSLLAALRADGKDYTTASNGRNYALALNGRVYP